MEIERRKQAEDALNSMERQWERVREQLSLVGAMLPAALTIAAEDEKLDFNPAEELCQQASVARVVANAVGRGSAKAEVEMEMESWIESKNFEIARFWDRLHYETVNNEMSQRNQEAVEMALRHRQTRKRRQRWIWSSIGITIALGSAVLVWSYLPIAKGSLSTDSSDFYRSLSEIESLSQPVFGTIWGAPIPYKVNLFMWEACLQKLHTQDRLQKCGVVSVNRCSMCKKVLKSVHHLLLSCCYA